MGVLPVRSTKRWSPCYRPTIAFGPILGLLFPCPREERLTRAENDSKMQQEMSESGQQASVGQCRLDLGLAVEFARRGPMSVSTGIEAINRSMVLVLGSLGFPACGPLARSRPKVLPQHEQEGRSFCGRGQAPDEDNPGDSGRKSPTSASVSKCRTSWAANCSQRISAPTLVFRI